VWRFILKGFHFSLPFFPKIHFGNIKKLCFIVKFDKSCIYTPDENNHTNKLYGVSFGNHIQNSVRFGWRSDGKKIELMSFIHEDGKFYYQYLASLRVDKIYELQIIFKDNKSVFSINGIRLGEYVFKKKIFDRMGYFLNPYFGGKPTSPHFMKIWIKNSL